MAWELLTELLSADGFPEATLTNTCPRCGGPHGAVQVHGAPWRASVTYAGSLAISAVYPDVVSGFAIDGETLSDPVRDAAGPVPGGLLRWVRVEAVLKADGRGLRVAPETVELTPHGDDWTARLPASDHVFDGWEPVGPPGIWLSAAIRR